MSSRLHGSSLDLASGSFGRSVCVVALPAHGRGTDLQVRISVPLLGSELPTIVFSHGNGQSLHGYAPLIDHWVDAGFIVLQPTHLDSRELAVAPDDPRRPSMWRFRQEDVLRILDNLSNLEAAMPQLRGRFDPDRIAVAGHSWGGQTVSTMLGATHPDPDDGSLVRRKDERIRAGVLLSTPGSGGRNLNARAALAFPFMHPDFSGMTTTALVVVGDKANGGMTWRGPDWWREVYDLSPSPKALLTLSGGEHSLGGIAGYEARETTDERPERVAAVRSLSAAFLRSALNADDPSWRDALAQLAAATNPEGYVETK